MASNGGAAKDTRAAPVGISYLHEPLRLHGIPGELVQDVVGLWVLDWYAICLVLNATVERSFLCKDP